MTLRAAPPRPLASKSAPAYPRAVASVAVAAAALLLSGCLIDPLHETSNQGDLVPAFEEDTGAWDTGSEDTGSKDTGSKDTGGKDTGASTDAAPSDTGPGPDPAGGQPFPFDDAAIEASAPETPAPDAPPDPDAGQPGDGGLKPMTP